MARGKMLEPSAHRKPRKKCTPSFELKMRTGGGARIDFSRPVSTDTLNFALYLLAVWGPDAGNSAHSTPSQGRTLQAMRRYLAAVARYYRETGAGQ